MKTPSLLAASLGLALLAGAASCKQPLYLTFDTGHMEVAPLIAEVLQRQAVRVTFFAANERTKVGDGSLGEHWAPWWRERAAEGHDFASHTFDHAYWRADLDANKFKTDKQQCYKQVQTDAATPMSDYYNVIKFRDCLVKKAYVLMN